MEANELQHVGVVHLEGDHPIFQAFGGDFAPFDMRVAKLDAGADINEFLNLRITVIWNPVPGESGSDMLIRSKILHSEIANRALGLFQCGARGNSVAHWLAAEDELLGFFLREFLSTGKKLAQTGTAASGISDVPEDARVDCVERWVHMLRVPDARAAGKRLLRHSGTLGLMLRRQRFLR